MLPRYRLHGARRDQVTAAVVRLRARHAAILQADRLRNKRDRQAKADSEHTPLGLLARRFWLWRRQRLVQWSNTVLMAATTAMTNEPDAVRWDDMIQAYRRLAAQKAQRRRVLALAAQLDIVQREVTQHLVGHDDQARAFWHLVQLWRLLAAVDREAVCGERVGTSHAPDVIAPSREE